MDLLKLRKGYGLTQNNAAAILGMPLRTYIRYEKDEKYGDVLKRQSMASILVENCEITEDKGILTVEKIKQEITKLFESEYNGKIEFCYLFGSYAKGYAKEGSDVDLCVATSLSGLQFVGLSESIREVLHKKIDLVRFSNLRENIELIGELLKDGIKIYEQQQR